MILRDMDETSVVASKGIGSKVVSPPVRHQLMLYTTWFEYSQAGYHIFIEVENPDQNLGVIRDLLYQYHLQKPFLATLNVTLKP